MALPSFLSNISSKLFGGSAAAVGVDIGSSAIKVVQIHKEKGTAVLDTYGSLAIGPYIEGREIGQHTSANEEVLHTVLSTLLKEVNISEADTCAAIPFHASLISLIDLPPLTDEKIAQIIPFEAKRYIPIPLEDVSLDWFVVPRALLENEDDSLFQDETKQSIGMQEQEEKRKVLLIAVHNHELRKHRSVLDRTDLKTKHFEIEIFSTLRSALYETRLSIMLIDIGARTTKFYIVDRGIILRSLFINQGGESMTQAIANTENLSFKEAEYKKREQGCNLENPHAQAAVALVLDEILAETNTVILDYEQAHRKSISKIIFTGGGAMIEGLLEEAEKKLNKSVEIANPFGRLKHPAQLSETLKQTGSEFTVAVGSALRMLGE